MFLPDHQTFIMVINKHLFCVQEQAHFVEYTINVMFMILSDKLGTQ